MQIKPPGAFTRGKISLAPSPHITPDTLCMELQRAWSPQGFHVYKTALIGLDVAVRKSGWTGIGIKIKQYPQYTELVYNAFAPSAFVRVMFMGLIPILIVNSTSWKPLLRSFEHYVQTTPYYAGQLPGQAQPMLMQGQPMQGQPMQAQYPQHAQQPQPAPAQAQQPQSHPCPRCHAPLQWSGEHQAWFCGACQQWA